MKHSLAPWTYKRTHELSNDTWYVVVDANGRGPIIDVGGKDMDGQIGEMKYLVTDPEVIKANAALIAAAPELLLSAQLQEILVPTTEEESRKLDAFAVSLGWNQDCPLDAFARNYRRAAIRKVEGSDEA